MSSRRILYINPGETDEALDQRIKEYLSAFRSTARDTIDVVSMPMTPQHLEYHAYHALIAPEILREVIKGERAGYDGCIIGCFDDPCLDAAREVCEHMVVTGSCEASVHLAATLGTSFSVIVGKPAWEARMRQRIIQYVGPGKLASFRSVGLGVLDFQADHERTERLIQRAVKDAISEDHAEAIVLGCTMEFGFFQRLQRECDVPVIDACLAPLKYLEMLMEINDKCGWYHSKISNWATPRHNELKEWGLNEKYGFTI
jgi:allantoin racemase